MDERTGNDPRSGDDLEETLARKRSRRVSFADTTAVHVFDRDEDFETPPTTESKPSPSTVSYNDDQSLGLPGVLAGEDRSEDVDDKEKEEEERSVRDMDSSPGSAAESVNSNDKEKEEEERSVRDMDSSPGSAAGSVNSNDDDNFFGPVSTSFIRSGRLPKSGMSDDNNHDITLDSTAFSLHFQNIARPDDCTANSSRSLRTPTGDSMPTDSPGFLVQGFLQLESGSRLSDGKLSSTAGNTTNMSLIVENTDKFDDYGRMSPTLEALMAEANKNIHSYSPIGGIRGLTSKVCDEEVAVVKESEKNKTPQGSLCKIGNAVDGACIETQLASSCSVDTAKLICYDIPSHRAENPPMYASTDEKTQGPLSAKVNGSFRSVCGPIQSNIVAADAQMVDVFASADRNPEVDLSLESGQIHEDLSLNKVGRSRHYSNSSPELRSRIPTLLSIAGQEQASLFEHGMHTPKDAELILQPSLQGSISSLRSKRQQLFYDLAVLSQTKSQEGYLFLKGDGRSSTFLEENNIPSNDSYIPSNISQEKIDNSTNCDSGNTEVTNSVSLKETVFQREMLSSNSHSLGDACGDSSSANKSRKFSGDTAQSPNNNNNCNNNMVYSSNLEESVPSNLSKDCIPFGYDISYHDQQFLEDDITGKKRAFEQIFQTNKDCAIEMTRSPKSQKVMPNVMGSGIFSSEHLHCSNESQSIGGEGPQGHWRAMISVVSEATRQLFSPAICKLSSQKLDIIEDALSVLQIGRKYDRLSASLRNHELPGVLKREAETRSLLDKLVCKKAMVHLKRIKLDQLYNKEHVYKLQIQECNKLKSIYLQLCARTVQKSHFHSVSSNPPRNNQEEHGRVKSMREELEMLGQKVKILMKYFETSCKTDRDMNCERTINVVNDHLETVNLRRAIQQNLQLWKVSDVMKKNDCCNIVLRYQDLLTQSFAINYCSASSMVANDFLINTSIEKKFPSMNASAAFEFVFKTKGDAKVISLKHIPRETMETNLLFGTLLDVLEEILVSRMEMWNLVSSTFHSQCCQLELRLCFLSFKSGVKVSLCLDMSGLNCGIYPLEASELLIRISSEHITLPPSISEEIRSRVGDLRSGRSMIFRLCQSISQMVRVSI